MRKLRPSGAELDCSQLPSIPMLRPSFQKDPQCHGPSAVRSCPWWLLTTASPSLCAGASLGPQAAVWSSLLFWGGDALRSLGAAFRPVGRHRGKGGSAHVSATHQLPAGPQSEVLYVRQVALWVQLALIPKPLIFPVNTLLLLSLVPLQHNPRPVACLLSLILRAPPWEGKDLKCVKPLLCARRWWGIRHS